MLCLKSRRICISCLISCLPRSTTSKKTSESCDTSKQSVPSFHSERFTSDKTDALVARLLKLETLKSKSKSYFGWKGAGFQCGICFRAVPSHVSFTVNKHLMSMDSDPPEDTRKRPPETLLNPSKPPFLPSMLSEKSKYTGDVHHPWL